MNQIKKYISGVGDVLRIIVRTLGSYIGVFSSILSAILGIMASVLVVCVIGAFIVYIKVLPEFNTAREIVFDKLINMSEEDFILKEDTLVFDKNDKKVGSVNAGRYEYTKIQKISPYIYNGYIAVEDKRFRTHGGVDMLATLRAGVTLLKNNGAITQGGSTITQQTIKNNLLSQEKSFTRKIAEIMLAPTVEAKFSKDKIMEFYCNSNYYGNRCYGVASASKFYFGKKADDLEPQEAALLIGLSNNPSAYDPVNNPEDSLKKRNEVLGKMLSGGAITQSEYDKAIKKEIEVLQLTEDYSTAEGYVVSYAIHCAAIAMMEQEDFEFKYNFKNKKAYEKYNKEYSQSYSEKCNLIREGGFKLYTSIDMDMQDELQKSIDDGLSFNKEKVKKKKKYALQGAAVCVDNESNYVVAIVGGRGTKDSFNRAYLAYRQSGSSIKPLVDYAPGFESGLFFPSSKMQDKKIKNGPQNAGGGYRGNIRIREAVARSINTIAWQVLQRITPKYGLDFLGKMRFHGLSYVDNDNLSVSLGGFTNGVRVVDMAKGYSCLANNGSYSDRTCIRKIKRSGKGTIYTQTEELTQVYNEQVAWIMTDILKGVLEESYGTGHALRLNNNRVAAGKTGTTNSSKDVWFCGYTKQYTTVVWAGYDTPRAMPGVTGGSLPGKIWKDYMNKIHKDLDKEDFEAPDGVVLARYHEDGKIDKGTESKTNLNRYSGKDFFSSTVLKNKSNYASELQDESYQRQCRKKLEAFEEMNIKKIVDYYRFKERYEDLQEMIAIIEDDDVRRKYATRAKDHYESLEDESVKWKEVVEEYEEQKMEELKVQKAKDKRESEAARKKQQKENRIKLAKTRLESLKGHKYQPKNMKQLLKQAKKAIDACVNYKEYQSFSQKYAKYVAKLEGLPTKEEYDKKYKNKKPVDGQTPEPSAAAE